MDGAVEASLNLGHLPDRPSRAEAEAAVHTPWRRRTSA